jgi:DNA-binding NarL/FixJ family response regulator
VFGQEVPLLELYRDQDVGGRSNREEKVRERQVLALMGEGLSNTDIATRLHISEKTVRNQASNIFDKLGVWSRAQAIVFARDRHFSS